MSFQRGPEQLTTYLHPLQGLTFPLCACCSEREPRSGLQQPKELFCPRALTAEVCHEKIHSYHDHDLKGVP